MAVERQQRPQEHPVAEHRARRVADLQLRVANRIMAFAGPMSFVYLHAALLAGWMICIESDQRPELMLIISLEALFLSAFVMIGQPGTPAHHRPASAAFRQR
ncbi:hypothetical protein ACL02O_20630 [Micromonospora sp. MS34]|uniref:hypothetical protein n=1 Tax=Micromonospora sp. MS34 TaxID=3385971 RepID=UPI00399FDC6D